MKSRPFMDDDWTGLTHEQIRSRIIAEYEEKQCRRDGHEWTPSYYCRICGMEGDEALEGLTGKRKYWKHKKQQQYKKKQNKK